MKQAMKRTAAVWVLAALASAGAMARGQAKPTAIEWSGADAEGKPAMVPVAEKASVVTFVKTDQPQSAEALKQIAKVVQGRSDVQVLVVVSGQQAAEEAKELKAGNCPWPVVLDPSFGISGKMGVHVWPTTLVVKPDAQQAAHLAGLAKSFSFELDAYLAFATGKMDQVALEKHLTTREVVGDSDEQKAARHLTVAQRLLEQGRPEPALNEVEAGLRIRPDDAQLKLARARALVMAGRVKEGLEAADALPAGAVSSAQKNVLRGRALIALGQWPEAKTALAEAVKLNPDPSEAHYLSGLVFQHEADWNRAAEQFRLAFESSAVGRKMTVSSR